MTKNYYGKLLSSPAINYKAKKNLKLNVHTYYLSLAHSDLSGYNVCPLANKLSTQENNTEKSNCSSVCVAGNGNGRYPNVIKGRIRKTKRFFEDRESFLNDLIQDIQKAILFSEYYGFIPTFRLNAYSDIKWEKIKVNSQTIFELFPDVQFYDYTKIPNRKTPNNYSLTYSHYGKMDITRTQMSNGYNVAMVFNSQKNDKLPNRYNGIKVIDGDKTDLRTKENDGVNVIVGLRAKMSKANITKELNKKMSFVVQQ